MPSTLAPPADAADAPVRLDGLDVLDACHRQSLFALGKLAALVTRLQAHGCDAHARGMAAEIVAHFATNAREHHEDEERHVFPALFAEGDEAVVATVMRLQQDHFWMEEDWRDLGPQLEAVAAGHAGVDVERLRACAQVFIALCHDHIALEESCIYPQARRRLGAGERQDIGRQMAARRHAAREG